MVDCTSSTHSQRDSFISCSTDRSHSASLLGTPWWLESTRLANLLSSMNKPSSTSPFPRSRAAYPCSRRWELAAVRSSNALSLRESSCTRYAPPFPLSLWAEMVESQEAMLVSPLSVLLGSQLGKTRMVGCGQADQHECEYLLTARSAQGSPSRSYPA